jgi:hypothetical protein
VSHCMGAVLRIARKVDRRDWKREVAKLPDACDKPDCGAPRSCRARATEYLQMQARMADRRGTK